MQLSTRCTEACRACTCQCAHRPTVNVKKCVSRSSGPQALHIRCTRKMSMDMLRSVVHAGPGKSGTTDGVLTEQSARTTDPNKNSTWFTFW